MTSFCFGLLITDEVIVEALTKSCGKSYNRYYMKGKGLKSIPKDKPQCGKSINLEQNDITFIPKNIFEKHFQCDGIYLSMNKINDIELYI